MDARDGRLRVSSTDDYVGCQVQREEAGRGTGSQLPVAGFGQSLMRENPLYLVGDYPNLSPAMTKLPVP